MEILPEDQKVVDLLSKLKDTNGGYPSEMFASRRQTYMKQVANIGLGVGAGLKNTTKGGNGSGATTTITGKILEVALVAAIAIEAGTAAYLYRDKIADLIQDYTVSSDVQIEAPPAEDTNNILVETMETSSVTATLSSTPSVIASSTPAPNIVGNNNTNLNNNSATNMSVNSTPNPGGNNGNHFGQTPKPERTKVNNGGGNGNGNGSGGGNGTSNGNGNGNNNKP